MRHVGILTAGDGTCVRDNFDLGIWNAKGGYSGGFIGPEPCRGYGLPVKGSALQVRSDKPAAFILESDRGT